MNLKRRGLPIPEDKLPPVLWSGLELYYDAFLHLSTTRVAAMSPISWLSIEIYADRLGFEGLIRLDLHHHVRALDQRFLAFHEKKGRGSGKDKGGHPPERPEAQHPPRRGRR